VAFITDIIHLTTVYIFDYTVRNTARQLFFVRRPLRFKGQQALLDIIVDADLQNIDKPHEKNRQTNSFNVALQKIAK
jgi:hypothetical protein